MKIKSYEYKKIAYGIYLVRTQAGFNQAVKEVIDDRYEYQSMEVYGFSTSYPAIVSISIGYAGYHYVQCTSVHVNIMKEAIEGE